MDVFLWSFVFSLVNDYNQNIFSCLMLKVFGRVQPSFIPWPEESVYFSDFMHEDIMI